MSEFEAQEIKARIALRDLEEKTKLVKVIKRKGNLLIGSWPMIVSLCWAIPIYLEDNFSDKSNELSIMTIIVPSLFLVLILGSVNHKLNTLVRLLEIDKYLSKKEE